MNRIKILSGTITTAVMLGFASTSFAIPITIVSGVGAGGGSGDVDNVLYSANQTGNAVNAVLNTSGGAFAALFTSDTSLSTAGGQAHLTASDGGTFADLCFSLLDGMAFTKLQLNPDAVADGFITFDVSYIMDNGTPYSEQFTLNGAGENFFTILATDGALMTEVCWTSTVGISDANQYRVGGVTAPPPGTSVPDGGATAMLLGAGLIGLAAVRRKLGV